MVKQTSSEEFSLLLLAIGCCNGNRQWLTGDRDQGWFLVGAVRVLGEGNLSLAEHGERIVAGRGACLHFDGGTTTSLVPPVNRRLGIFTLPGQERGETFSVSWASGQIRVSANLTSAFLLGLDRNFVRHEL